VAGGANPDITISSTIVVSLTSLNGRRFQLTVAATRIAAKPTPVHVVGLILLVLAVNCVDPPDTPFLWRHPVWYLLVGDIPLYGLLGLGVFFGHELWSHRKLTLNPAYGQD